MDFLGSAEEKVDGLMSDIRRIKLRSDKLADELSTLYGMFVEELSTDHRNRILDLLGEPKP